MGKELKKIMAYRCDAIEKGEKSDKQCSVVHEAPVMACGELPFGWSVIVFEFEKKDHTKYFCPEHAKKFANSVV